MKIGIDIRAIGKKRTGDETYVLNLVRGLAKTDNENRYFLYTDTKNENELVEIRRRISNNNNFPDNFEIISILPASKMLWTFFLLPKHIRKNPVDVLHVQYITPQFSLGKTKLVTTIHDVSFEAFPQLVKKSDLFFLKTLIPRSIKKADRVIAISDFTKKEIEKYYKIDSQKIAMVYNGGAGEEFFKRYDEDEKNKVLEKYAIKKPFVLYIGTHQPRKNLSFLIEGFARMKKEKNVSELKLVVGGKTDGYNSDKEIQNSLNKIGDLKKDIHFIGYADYKDLPLLYQSAETFCFPSLYEGFGLPIIEAMASETPVLCDQESVLGEIGGDGAVYYQRGDLDDFTNKLFDLIINNEEKNKIKIKGRERAGKFSWNDCALQTLQIYKELAEKE